MDAKLKDKIQNNLALAIPELSKATGYSKYWLRKQNLPLVGGKLGLDDFWAWVQQQQSTAAAASLHEQPASETEPTEAKGKMTALRLLYGLPPHWRRDFICS